MANREWKVAFLVLLSVVAGVLLAGRGVLPAARGQSEGRAGNLICVLGENLRGYAPIVLVDGQERTILVYEYSYGDDRIELTSARTFEFDRLIKEYNVEGLSVGQVQSEVTRTR
jgi:hypothetical protein